MYEVKIPGTKYFVVLEKDLGDWYVRLKIANSIESESLLNDLSVGSVKAGINDVIAPISYMVNPVQAKKITGELLERSKGALAEKSKTSARQTTAVAIQNENIHRDEWFSHHQDLVERFSQLTVRVSHLEKIVEDLVKITDSMLKSD